ncbi:MAG TPA: hypothetical protein VMW38_10540, partial [Terriglobia bacterium]|nr:hypothetical protein [Terriglobia bacterium]
MAEDLSDKTPAQADWKVVAPQAASEEVKRILKDPVFHYSQRCKSLLKYIVDKSLKGQHQELKERIIGIEVFGRSPDYDTSNDATVRVAVNEVRKRLSQYYSKAEHKQELRIDIPVRSYVAEFNPPGRGPDKALTHNGYRVFGRWYLWAAAAVVILGLAAWMIVQSPFRVSAIDEFWAPLLSSSRSISICVGMPLNTKWDSTESKPLPDPTTQNAPTYANDQRIIVDKEDIAGGEQFLAYLHQKGKEAVIRPSQGFDLAALQSDSLILEGMYMNEWAERFWPDLHFQFRKDPNVDLRWIEGT